MLKTYTEEANLSKSQVPQVLKELHPDALIYNKHSLK